MCFRVMERQARMRALAGRTSVKDGGWLMHDEAG